MKFAVGVMLTSFGTFWGAEGAGVAWPGNDAALLVLVPVVALVAAACIFWLRSRKISRHRPRQAIGGRRLMKQLKAFGAFWYDFIVGDDWHVAALVVAGLGAHRDPGPRGAR